MALPCQYTAFSTPIPRFVAMLDEHFAIEFRDSQSIKTLLGSLPQRPTDVIMEDV